MFVRKRLYGEFRIQVERPLQRHGSVYGGWTLDPSGIEANSIVYSFGVGEDLSFDLSLIQTFGCQVYAFDPIPKSIAWVGKQDLPPQLHFFGFGIAAHDGEGVFSPPPNPEHVSYTLLARPETMNRAIRLPVFRLQTIMNHLGHRHIDLLKMDVEGAEYSVLSQIDLKEIDIGQILVEFHHRFNGVGWQQTQRTINLLHQQGFKTAYVSSSGEEFSFIRSQR